ncbi:MAG TPA: TetR/AcrR family transcriptional regulator [Solirubrobacteraceae bacterium]|jgi:AcrR family transcriptional regulator|nr:TetR/AcrR family transcriptional regulator [Solirubrobacteraceae bacterium]
MPKIVDRERQRQEIGAALLDIVGTRGFDEVSVRTVAAASGRSAGAVQKYFQTKDDMLLFALDMAGDRVVGRLAEIDMSGTIRDVLRRLVVATLPLDGPRRAEAAVWAAFAARAACDAKLAAVLREVDRAVAGDLVAGLDDARAAGQLSGSASSQSLADAVIAVSDGLALRMLYAPAQSDALLEALDSALEGLLA